MPTDPTLLYGIGAQKAGTSWLYDYLSAHPECHFRTLKELHYFDLLEKSDRVRMEKKMKDRVTGLRWMRRAQFFRSREDLKRGIRDIDGWFDIFEDGTTTHRKYLDYVFDGAGDARVVGDITPSYARQSEAGFAEMARLAPKSKFIFLMRDPVDRLWSSIRMSASRATIIRGNYEKTAFDLMDRYLAGKKQKAEEKSDYVATITRLTAAVPAKDIHFEFFESLFSGDAVRRITDFLGLSPRPADTGTVILKGKPLSLDADRRSRAIALLKPQYDFVERTFGDRVPDRWKSNLVSA